MLRPGKQGSPRRGSSTKRRGRRAEGRAARSLRQRRAAEGGEGRRGSAGGDRAPRGARGRGGTGDALHLPQCRGLRRSAPPRCSRLPRPSSSAPARGAAGGGAGRASGAEAAPGPGCAAAAPGGGRCGEPGAGRAAAWPRGLVRGGGCTAVSGAVPWGAEPAVCPPAGTRQTGRRYLLLCHDKPGLVAKGL